MPFMVIPASAAALQGVSELQAVADSGTSCSLATRRLTVHSHSMEVHKRRPASNGCLQQASHPPNSKTAGSGRSAAASAADFMSSGSLPSALALGCGAETAACGASRLHSEFHGSSPCAAEEVALQSERRVTPKASHLTGSSLGSAFCLPPPNGHSPIPCCCVV